MKFSKNGPFDVVTRISGPHHHYLGVVLEIDRARSAVDVEGCTVDGSTAPVEPTCADELRSEVSSGINAANRRLGTRFGVSRIRYCLADPAVSGVYRAMAEHLVEHVEQSQAAVDILGHRLVHDKWLNLKTLGGI